MVPLALLALYIIWGSTYWVMVQAMGAFPPFVMGGIRFTVAGLLLLGWARARGTALPTGRQWASSALVGVLLLTLGNGLVAVAEHGGVSSGVAATVIATMPLWTVLFGALFGERPRALEVVGLLVGFSGVVVLRWGGALSAPAPAVLALACAPASWALGSVASRRLPLPKGVMATAAQMLLGGLVMGALGLARGEHVQHVTLRAVLALSYLVGFGSILAFSAYGFLLRTVRPALATSYAYVNPVVALALGSILGGEAFGATHAIACFWTLVGVGIVSYAVRARRAAAP